MPTTSGMDWTFGGPNIVDLDGNGSPSILFGPYVLNADGSVRTLGGYTEITSARADERQIRFGLRLSF